MEPGLKITESSKLYCERKLLKDSKEGTKHRNVLPLGEKEKREMMNVVRFTSTSQRFQCQHFRFWLFYQVMPFRLAELRMFRPSGRSDFQNSISGRRTFKVLWAHFWKFSLWHGLTICTERVRTKRLLLNSSAEEKRRNNESNELPARCLQFMNALPLLSCHVCLS